MSGRVRKHSEDEYLRLIGFTPAKMAGCDCRSAKMFTARKSRLCTLSIGSGAHYISAGERVWKETWKIDGQIGSCFICISCLDRMVEECSK